MSAYITVKEAKLKKNPKYDILVKIESDGSELLTHTTVASKNPKWASSLISSIRQRKLKFTIIKKKQFKEVIIGEGILNFEYFQFTAQKQLQYCLPLEKDNFIVGYLYLTIFYTQLKKFLGEIQFYQFENDFVFQRANNNNNNNNKDKDKDIQFYKGPCRTKNIFSCCDESVNSQQFQIMEQYYRKK